MDQLIPFLWIAAGVFVITSIVQLAFPVEVYQRARESNLDTVNKGRFAYTVESLFQIKTKGFDADGKYWWHITWFNSAVSISVSALVVFGIIIILAILGLIVVFGVLMSFGSSK